VAGLVVGVSSTIDGVVRAMVQPQQQGIEESVGLVHGDRDQPLRVGSAARSAAVITLSAHLPASG